MRMFRNTKHFYITISITMIVLFVMVDIKIKIVEQIGLLLENIATSKLFFENINLSFAELRCLLFIIKSKKCTMSDLTQKFKIPASTATGIVDRLVKYGYVSRERNKDDRRKVFLTSTEEAIDLHQGHYNLILKEMKKILDSLSKDKKELLLNSLQQINSLLNKTSLNIL